MTRIVAVDIGNSYLHAQVFETSDLARTPADPMDADPPHRLHRALRAAELASLPTDVGWFLASVNRDRQEELTAWLTARGSESRAISRRDCPLAVALPAPVTAGVDRLVAAVAANHLRDPA
ncbi:MAG: type III pantothenate kinase, partial [Pirellulaceae bacterium]|nr:type III pantothenate kinase [Pirellulaceae bacterium]